MTAIPLLGGAYQARSTIANAQRCVNYFPEVNPRDAPVPVTHYQRPGLRRLVAPPIAGIGRGVFRASNGNGYCVIGQTVYQITWPGGVWTLTKLGTLTTLRTNVCYFTDLGASNASPLGLLVDGSPQGYTINLLTGAFATLNDPTGTFTGADRVDYIDTFVLWNIPGTNRFGSSLSNTLTFDATYVAGKTGFPDPLAGLIVNRHEIALIGQLKTEQWYDAGNANFPFAEVPGAYFEHGTISTYSIAAQDISVYYLGQDLQGSGVVFRIRGYECTRISNHALEYQLRQMRARGSTLADAIGYTYQQDGHVFYVLTFPSGDQTWVFDEASNEWHQRAWTGPDGTLHRDRLVGAAWLNETNVGLDWQTGDLVELDLNYYLDDVSGVPGPITYARSFPHVLSGTLNFGIPGLDRGEESNGHIIQYNDFILNMDCGGGPQDISGAPALVGLRSSSDRGKTFGNQVLQSAGTAGAFTTRPTWKQLGLAQDMVFEIVHSIAGPAALNGAWVSARVTQN